MAARVGQYLLLETLGHGSFGKVKLGVHETTGNQVAIKIIEKADIHEHSMTLQVKREIAIMKNLTHENIVSLYEVLTSKTKLYLVIELVTGGELFDVIAKRGEGGLPEIIARRYFQQLIDAIHYCHQRGVFHRDLKPENLLLDHDEKLKVTDFGLSAIRGASTSAALLTTQCGTPSYIAPEIISLVDEGYNGDKVDAWACGIILFALLAGYLPFEGESTTELFLNIQKADVEYPKWISPGARRVIEHLLTKNPNTRWNMKQVKQDEWFQVDYTGDDAKGKTPQEVKPISLYSLQGLLPPSEAKAHGDRPRVDPNADPSAQKRAEAAAQVANTEVVRRQSFRQLRVSSRIAQPPEAGQIFGRPTAPITQTGTRGGGSATNAGPTAFVDRRTRPTAPVHPVKHPQPDSAIFRNDSVFSTASTQTEESWPLATAVQSERIHVPAEILNQATAAKKSKPQVVLPSEASAMFEDADDDLSDLETNDEDLSGTEEGKTLMNLRELEIVIVSAKQCALPEDGSMSSLILSALNSGSSAELGGNIQIPSRKVLLSILPMVKAHATKTEGLSASRVDEAVKFIDKWEETLKAGRPFVSTGNGFDDELFTFHRIMCSLDRSLVGEKGATAIDIPNVQVDEPNLPEPTKAAAPPSVMRANVLQFNMKGQRVDYSQAPDENKAGLPPRAAIVLEKPSDNNAVKRIPPTAPGKAMDPLSLSKNLDDPVGRTATRNSVKAAKSIFGRSRKSGAPGFGGSGFFSGLPLDSCIDLLIDVLENTLHLPVKRKRGATRLKVTRTAEQGSTSIVMDVHALPSGRADGALSEVSFMKDRSENISHFDSSAFVALCKEIEDACAAANEKAVLLQSR
mmetsp:Transcript_3699/g.6477  ORF Transcript_3699/g.6477 Transcript_3699/m.6477 type:complete len:855 (-) Transcript_3699:1306-3870(-)|eukprot:CAMPEP_0182449794 /NCGR_PEP_ID=MMETSP1172-20130603/36697_1 /TAXON_ID=708627 /ORGANISM="Timspurckia oligopyrenoides, Strain CCMP3278" /LENGTH=854 /DNA_ID=CAMNT_0024647171 /DNA_START=65 /DNA_END=2629 /DNA_ORIENTATION=-